MGTVRQRNWGFVRGMRGVAAGISTATRCSWKKRMTKWREKVEAAESAHKSGHEQAASINSIKKREGEREKNVAQPRIRNFQLFFLHDDSKTALFKPYRIRWPRLYSFAPPFFLLLAKFNTNRYRCRWDSEFSIRFRVTRQKIELTRERSLEKIFLRFSFYLFFSK